jgi:hypothetical protein
MKPSVSLSLVNAINQRRIERRAKRKEKEQERGCLKTSCRYDARGWEGVCEWKVRLTTLEQCDFELQ